MKRKTPPEIEALLRIREHAGNIMVLCSRKALQLGFVFQCKAVDGKTVEVAVPRRRARP